MNEGFQSDEFKRQIRDFKRRKAEGLVETYEDATGEKIEEGNIGLAKQKIIKDSDSPTGWHIVAEEKNALGLLKRENKSVGILPRWSGNNKNE